MRWQNKLLSLPAQGRLEGIFLFLLLLIVSCQPKAPTDDLAAVYEQIDQEIEASEQYVEQKEQLLQTLRRDYQKADTEADMLQAAYRLYEENQSYSSDSAIHYLECCIELAEEIGQEREALRYKAQLGYLWSAAGYNYEGADVLRQIDTLHMDRQGIAEYYKAMNHVYNDLGYYTSSRHMQRDYYALADTYRQKMRETLDRNSDDYLQLTELDAYYGNDPKEALRINDLRMKYVTPDSREYSIVAFYRNLDYALTNDSVQVRYWLSQAVIGDIRHAVMDQGAMWELAHLLAAEGDTERSNRYINFAWKCAERFGTRVRGMQILPVLSTVNESYQEEQTRSNTRLLWAVGAITMLVVLLTALLLYVVRGRNKLAMAQQQLSNTNSLLTKMNEEQQLLNKRLTQLNEATADANARLKESNRLKEEYIGKYMHVCTAYIDKMDEWRKQLHKLLKNREYEEAYMKTRSSEFKTKELDQFYVHFDEGFLSLFPNFVEEFNSLMIEEERIHLPDPKRLNTTLRIFALVRLGFDDSKEIADLLHCSMSTIYNYRTKARNSFVGNRNDLEKAVKQIGSTL